MVLEKKYIIVFLILFAFLLGSCSGVSEGPPLFSSPVRPEAEATPQPTPEPERVLSICLGQEPNSLFLYGDVSSSAKIIRQAIYDSSADMVDFQQSSVLLNPIPSLENGLVTVDELEVFPGERIVDARGDLTILASGVIFRPAGCTSSECWEVFDNQESITMDQVEITFAIVGGLSWSDGNPLAQGDSIFSYLVAREIYGSGGPAKTRYTSSYE